MVLYLYGYHLDCNPYFRLCCVFFSGTEFGLCKGVITNSIIMAGLEQRKTEQEQLSKEERLKQIQRMRERLDQHTANRNRDANARTISENTKAYLRQKQMQAPDKEPTQEKGIGR